MSQSWRTLIGAVVFFIPDVAAHAHCFVGSRFLPATLTVDDPCVADELSIPTVALLKNADGDRERDISIEVSKRITDTFGVSVNEQFTHIKRSDGSSVSGFGNLETTFKSQFYTAPAHEFVMSAALAIEWGGSGSKSIGAESFSVLTPALYVGKGFGDLPTDFGWVRAFAMTAQVGYAVPTSSSTRFIDPDTGDIGHTPNPRFLMWGGTLQYSLPYLKASVTDLGLPAFVNRLVPLVEVAFQSPVANYAGSGLVTTGTVNPGVLYIGDKFQLGVEAVLPVTRSSGTGTGVVGQLHIFLDDLFPTSIGRPLLASNP